MTTTLLNNRYQVIQVLGVGGFGETFLAEDSYMPSRRRCVIKQLKPIANDTQIYQRIQRRFEREAATLEYLGEGSDQIPKLYAYFSENGQFYLVQEWIQGQTLSNIVKTQGSLSETAVREILLSLLSVLNYIHGKGIIHRDIKPDNIILRTSTAQGTVEGKPVLIDFGAVKATVSSVVHPSGYLTQSLVIGTPGYMPCEQAAGRPVYATDIYSLGLTAIYLLTGKHPYELLTNPQTGEIFWQHHIPKVSRNLAIVLNRAIKPQASDRYTTASKMLQALQSATAPRLFVSREPEPDTGSPEQTAAKTTLPLLSSNNTASGWQTQTLAFARRIPVTLISPINRRQKPQWIVGSLVVGGLIAAVAIASITRKHASVVPIATSPTTIPLSQSPAPTSYGANKPPAKTPIPPTSSQKRRRPTALTSPQPENLPVTLSPGTTNISRVPEFGVGTARSTVEAALGKPAKSSRGFWRNTHAVTYNWVPNRIELGYLYDRDSGVVKETEVAFAQSVSPQVMQTTLEGILGGKATEEIQQKLQQVQQRKLDNFKFPVGSLKGQIVRQDCDLIYISIWDANLHDFVSPSYQKKC